MQKKKSRAADKLPPPHAQYPHCTTFSARSCTKGCTSSWTGTRHQTKPGFDEDTGSLDSNLGPSGASYTRLNTKAFGTPHDVKKLESHSSSSCKYYTKNRALKSEPTQKAVSSNYCAAPNKETHSARSCFTMPMYKTSANGNKNWGVKVGDTQGQIISNLRFAGGISLMPSTLPQMKKMLTSLA